MIRLMNHVITEVPFYRDRTLVPGYDVGGKTGTAQIWDPKANEGRGGWKNNLFNYSFVGYIGRERAVRTWSSPSRSRRARRRSSRSATSRCRSCPSSSSGAIATDAITTPDLLSDGRAGPSAPRPADR